MRSVNGWVRLGAAAAASAMAVAAGGQVSVASWNEPTLDAWVYSFNESFGTEIEARLFGAQADPQFRTLFDNRDGQMLIGFDTSGQIVTGQPAQNYRVMRASLTLRVVRENAFRYDPTDDSVFSYIFPPGSAGWVPDADVGRPLEMFAAGYRYGFTAQTFGETTGYPVGMPPFPSRSVRPVFAAEWDGAAYADVSNSVDARRQTSPLAIGATDAVAPGELVPIDTIMTFAVDLRTPGASRYLQDSLATGRLNFVVSSLFEATQQSAVVPSVGTREYAADLGGAKPTLLIEYAVGDPADWNGSGAVTVQDIYDFIEDWSAGRADFDRSGFTTVQDIYDFLEAWVS